MFAYCRLHQLYCRYNEYRDQWRHKERDGVSIVCSTFCSDADQRKLQSSASLACVRGIHRWPVDSPHKGPVTRKMFPFDDVIMQSQQNTEAGNEPTDIGQLLFTLLEIKCSYITTFQSFNLMLDHPAEFNTCNADSVRERSVFANEVSEDVTWSILTGRSLSENNGCVNEIMLLRQWPISENVSKMTTKISPDFQPRSRSEY